MKKIFFFLCAASLLCSCAGNKAEQTAESFLTNYLNMDYDAAAAYCDSTVAFSLRIASEGWQELDSALLVKIREASSSTRYEIVEVDDQSVKNEAHVSYLLYPMNSENGVEMSMTLVKEKGRWLVRSLR